MHILLGLAAVALAAYFAWHLLQRGPRGDGGASLQASGRGLAFLANGQLWLRQANGSPAPLQSTYAEEAAERRERTRERHGWKQNTAFGIAGRGGVRDFESADAPFLVTSAVFQGDGSLLYFQKDAAIGGLFRRDAASGTEQRLLLKPGLNLSGLALSLDGAQLAASLRRNDGVANIALMQPDGAGMREVTGGDTVDCCPCWIPGSPKHLLFQSSGLARNGEGYVVAEGPAGIQRLEMDTGTVVPIADDARFDHLRPRVCPQGNLYFIRRPHEQPQTPMASVLLDTLLFPFRLLRAVFHYLNFFSLMYSRKPLTSANGPAHEADLKQLVLQGRRIDAEKALRKRASSHGVPSLVPADWELIRLDPQGRETVVARHVASFDIAPDGTVLHSNGRGVFVLDGRGEPRLALTQPLVSELAAAPA
jgi:hypothetical protein